MDDRVRNCTNNIGTPDRSRTYNLILRTDLLYPVELPRHDYYFNTCLFLYRGLFNNANAVITTISYIDNSV